jgi:RNase E specificity factor CsrD
MHFTRTLYKQIIRHVASVVAAGFLVLNISVYLIGARAIEQQVTAQESFIEQTVEYYPEAIKTPPVSSVVLGWEYKSLDGVLNFNKRFSNSWSMSRYDFATENANIAIIHKTVISAYTKELILINITWLVLTFFILLSSHVALFKPWKLLKQLEIWSDKVTKYQRFKFFIRNEEFALVNTIRHLYQGKLTAEKGGQKADHFIRSQTFVDKTTGLGNRLYFEHRLDAILQEDKVYGAVLLVQFGALDSIREKQGNHVADEFVIQFADIIKVYLDDTAQSVVSRISANDFAILLPFIDGNEVEKVALNILRMSQKIKLPEYVDTATLCHIGADMYGVEDNSFQILAEADMALRAAQLHGPSGWFMYDSGELPASEIKGSVRWRTALQDALDNNLFITFFQPIVDRNGNVLHNEVQTRMLDSKREFIGANVFLPMAKKCGMIQQIDKMQLEFVILQLVQDKLAPVAVKIHSDSWLDRSFCNWLIQFLKRHPDYTQYLILEISEFELFQFAKSLKSTLAAVKRYGVKFLIDQVGLYVVNTSYLDYIDADYVKLHQSIVNQIEERPENQLFIRSLQSVAADKQLELFVSGVESENEWQLVKRLGVTGMQGNYLKHPSQKLRKQQEKLTLDGDNLDL